MSQTIPFTNPSKLLIVLCAIALTWTCYRVGILIKHPEELFTTQLFNVDIYRVLPYWNNTGYEQLPKLDNLEWLVPEYSPLPVGQVDPVTRQMVPRPPPFYPVFSRGQRALVNRLLDVFAKALAEHGLGDRFFINAGSLHGSIRHHDMIPYDDDVDVCVDETVWPKVRQILRIYEPNYLVYNDSRRAKFFTKTIPVKIQSTDAQYSRQTFTYPWLWPSVDICYYSVNNTHIWEVGGDKETRTWPISVVFPLLFRPFHTRWYPTPFNPIQYIRTMVPQDKNCIRPGYCHAFEKSIPTVKTPCETLSYRFPFVQRRVIKRQLVRLNSPQKDVGLLVICEENLLTRSDVDASYYTVHTLYLPVHPELATLDIFDYGLNHES